MVDGDFTTGILIIEGDILGGDGAHVQLRPVVINLQRDHLGLRRVVTGCLLIQGADAGILNMYLWNAFHRVRRHQILAGQLSNRPVGVGTQDGMERLVDLFELLSELTPLIG